MRAFAAARDVPPLLLRAGLAVGAAALAPPPLGWLAAPLLLGLATRPAAALAALAFAAAALAPPDVPTMVAALGLAALAAVLAREGGGALALDAPLARRAPGLARLLAPAQAPAYRAFGYRLALAFVLLTAGALLVLRGASPAQAVGLGWLIGGVGIALGLLLPWSAAWSALWLPIAVRLTDQGAWLGLGLCALALAFVEDDRVSVDAPLHRRGGLLPTVRREVVLERRR